MGAQRRQGPPVKSKARLQRFEEMQSQEFQKRSETNEIIPAGPRLGDKVINSENVSQRLWRPRADRQSVVLHAKRRDRRRCRW